MDIKSFISNTEARINSIINRVESWVTKEEHNSEQAIINEINKAETKLAFWKQALEDLKNQTTS